MSTALLEMGILRPRAKIKMSFKELCITAMWAGLALLVGMGIVSSVQAVSPAVAQTSISQGL